MIQNYSSICLVNHLFLPTSRKEDDNSKVSAHWLKNWYTIFSVRCLNIFWPHLRSRVGLSRAASLRVWIYTCLTRHKESRNCAPVFNIISTMLSRLIVDSQIFKTVKWSAKEITEDIYCHSVFLTGPDAALVILWRLKQQMTHRLCPHRRWLRACGPPFTGCET